MQKVNCIQEIRKIGNELFPQYKYENIEDRFIRMYYGTIFLLAGTTPCERDLMDFLAEEMNEDNIVINHEITRDKFRKTVRLALEARGEKVVKEYSDITIRKAFQTLREKDLLISVKKGAYMVNPKYFFKSTEKERLERIKLSIEFKRGFRNPELELIINEK